MFKNYLKIAFRNLVRHRGYSFINITGLALGMACAIVIAIYLQFELSFDRFHNNGSHIFRLVERQFFEGQNEKNLGQSTPWMGETLVEYPEVDMAVNFVDMGTIWIKHKDEMVEIPRALIADPDVFKVFSFKLLRGDPQTALLEPNAAVITKDTARRIFKEEDPVGQIIQGPDSKIYKITGVSENVPENSHIQFDLMVSIMEMRRHPVEWDNYDHYSPTYVLLNKNANPKTLKSKLSAHVKKYFRLNADHVSLYLQPLKDIHLRSKHIMWEINWQKGDITYIYFFSIIMFFIMLVACINFINLSTARSVNRAREVGIRKVIGANKSQLVKQFLGESLFFSICALFLSVVVVQIIQSMLESIIGPSMSFNYLKNFIFVIGIVFFLVSTGIFAGMYPAFVLSSFQPVVVLKSSFSQGEKSVGLRKVLVTLQFAVSITLILCTAVVSKQFAYLMNEDIGFDKTQVMVLPMTEQMQGHFDTVKEKLLSYPEIKGVTASTRKLGNPLWRNQIFFEGKNPESQWICPYMTVDYNFLSFYRIKLLAGRDFSPEYSDDMSSRSYIINETLANQIGWEHPLGKKFKIGDRDWGKVIGVVKDFNFRSLHHKIEPVAFYIYPPWLFHMSVRIGTEDIGRTLKYMEEKLQPYQSEQPFSYTFLDEDFARLYESEEKSRHIFGYFSLLAIAISCLGLFGLSSFTVTQKTKEIGIRKVMGASVYSIFSLISRRFVKWILFANIISWPIAYYFMNRWLQNFAYHVSVNIWIFILSGLTALVIALLSISYQSVKAATANPLKSLRYE
jgi:putative ABC transport system permease protein